MKISRQCEKCEVIIYLKDSKSNRYSAWQDGSAQCGTSTKYPGEFAGYCKKHWKIYELQKALENL